MAEAEYQHDNNHLIAYVYLGHSYCGEMAVSTDLFFAAIIPLAIWPKAICSGNGLALVKMQGMRFRIYAPESSNHFSDPALSSGVNVSIERLEMHFLTGANVSPINYTLTATLKAGYPTDVSSVCK
jgi:uncharacterized protein YqfA (UPF0365 family)